MAGEVETSLGFAMVDLKIGRFPMVFTMFYLKYAGKSVVKS